MTKDSKTVVCPACNSTDVTFSIVENVIEVPLAASAKFDKKLYVCAQCGASGDFEKEGDEGVAAAVEKVEKESVNVLLSSLSEAGISMAYFERALRLPQRTTSRWKKGESSAAVLALIRCVHTYPWILGVADSNFDSKVAVRAVIETASHIFYQAISTRGVSSSVELLRTNDKVQLIGTITMASGSEDSAVPLIAASGG